MNDIARAATAVVAAGYAALGLVLYAAPVWTADRWPWTVSPFAAMTIGAWFLGGAFAAGLAVRRWRWSVSGPLLLFLWAFALTQPLVLLLHAGELRPAPLLAPYLAVLAAAATGAGMGIAAIARAPRWPTPPRPPSWVVALGVPFLLFALYVAVNRIAGTAADAQVWPGTMTPLTGAAFGAFYLAVAVAATPALWDGRPDLLRTALVAAAVGALLVTVPALVNLHLFDFRARPGGAVYIGVYLLVLAVAGLVLAGPWLRGRRREVTA